MGILDEDVAKVRAATDFVQVAGEHVALKRSGRRWTGLCPFHAENTPSFSVNAEEGLYYCFGCQAKGDVITFVREIEHLDFVEAVEKLASKAGIQIRQDNEAASKDRQRRNRLIEAMEQAVDWYHQRLLTGPDANKARSYLRSRGYDGDVVRQFRIGWAPEDWDALSRALNLPDAVLTDSGLGFVNRRQRQQDAFRGRVMFPIFDVAGKPVAFGGRILAGAEGPKYKNSQETPIYSKRRTLYGLNWAKTDVVESSEVIVCEGYTDVIGFFHAGLPRAVATCGTAVGDEHFRVLKNFARRVVLAYDADAAGQTAAERFYQWEQEFGIDIRVAAFPRGADPADVARRDPDALRVAIEKAQPFLGFRIDRVLDAGDLRTPEGRARTAEAALAMVAEHPNELVRNEYVGHIAVRCGMATEQLMRSMRSSGGRTIVRPVRAAAPRPHDGPEVEALRLAISRPDDMADRLEEVLFQDELHLAAFRALASAQTLHAAIDGADPGAADLLQRLAVEETDADAAEVIIRLVREVSLRELAVLEACARREPDRTAELAEQTGGLRWRIEELRDDRTASEAAERLVAWLVDRNGEKA